MQVLLDHDRYGRLEEEARRRGQSVGATVRDAIDLLLEADPGRRLLARRALLRLDGGGGPEPDVDKDALLHAAQK